MDRVNVHLLPHALEDLPADAQDEARKIFSTPVGIAFQERAFDVLENAVGDIYGHLECLRLFAFLSQYPVTAYTYEVAPLISRGERPDNGKVKDLYRQGFRALINLCEETPAGDAAYIAQAGLTGKIEPYHIGVVNSTPPTVDQVVQLLETLADLERRNVRAYVHCEAGKGRTGVMTACIRMALQGWSAADAVTEAKNFGMWTPNQIAFIQNFGQILIDQFDASRAGTPLPLPALTGYPRLKPGSVRPTPAQLTASLSSVAQSDERGVA